MITWPRVPTVATGDRITSSQLDALAAGFNERYRSGLGDCAWRTVFYMLGLFRQVRMNDGDLFPPSAEFFQAYQMLNAADGSWPDTGPGDPAGVNTSGQIGGLVFGNGVTVASEDERLAGMPMSPTDATPKSIWELGKAQRGAYDPDTGSLGSPSFTAARSHFSIGFSARSPHGQSYGGFMPLPTYLGDCTDFDPGPPEIAATPSYEIKFTSLLEPPLPDHVYTGTCPNVVGDVAYIARTSFAYYVFLVGGGLDIYDVKEWLEGPYSGGAELRKNSNGAIQRVLNKFISDFRGTEGQRAAARWLAKAFDMQRFLSSQYHLAPARGHSDEENVWGDYPFFEWSGLTSYAEGDVAGSHTIAEGFVVASLFIEAEGLRSSAIVEIVGAEEEVLQTFTIEPEAGSYASIVPLATPITPGVITVRLASLVQFTDATGFLRLELAELWDYKPEVHDAYMCLRLASSQNGGVLDGHGTNEENAKEIGDTYFENCCLTNPHGIAGLPGSADEINSNGLYESARLLSKSVRIIPRQNFVGYEVDSEGRSICYLLRYAYGTGFDSPIDLFEGIADAIAPDAPAGGWSNEWLMGCSFKAYHPSDSSAWKTDGYTDVVTPMSNRCHFYHKDVSSGFSPDLRTHFDYGLRISTNPEAPSGYNYVHGENTADPCGEGATYRQNFYKSCQMYQPDPEIESAEAMEEGGVDMVKVTFKTRFHHCDTAPATILRSDMPDVSDTAAIGVLAADLAAEAYRSTENALREYLCWANYGTNCTKGGGQPGNAGRCSGLYVLADDPYGTCFPTFYAVKLIPKPYDDGNDAQNSTDTPLYAEHWPQMELYLRAMCEGFVDGTTTVQYACTVGQVYDYNYENLCYDAFGGRWVNTLATVATSRISSTNIRDDAPQGFGPVPNTICSSEIFNQFASAINLLDKVRVPVPMQLIYRQGEIGSANKAIAADWDDGGAGVPTCTLAGTYRTYFDNTPTVPTISVTGVDTDGTNGFQASMGANISDASCSGALFDLSSYRTDCPYHYSPLDPDILEAIPETWRDMLDVHGKLMALVNVKTYRTTVSEQADELTASNCCRTDPGCPPGKSWNTGAGTYLLFTTTMTETESCQILPSMGTITAPEVGRQIFSFYMRTGSGDSCAGSIVNTVDVTPFGCVMGPPCSLPNDAYFIQVPFE